MSGSEWTDAHRREAVRRLYEIAAEFIGIDSEDPMGPQRGQILMASSITLRPWSYAETEAIWRCELINYHLDAARISREVRRVRRLAEGGLVRETVWQARDEDGDVIREDEDERHANDLLGAEGVRIVKVTRIRRAT